jgi:hypothetical protein
VNIPNSARKKKPELGGDDAFAHLSAVSGQRRIGDLNPLSQPARNIANGIPSGVESGALGAREAPIDPGLAAVIDTWPALPAVIKAAILAMIRAKQ